MRKFSLVIILLSVALMAGGCTSYFYGYSNVTTNEINERKGLAVEWLSTAPFISAGEGEVTVLYDGVFKKTEVVPQPPKGSVFLLYQDIASKSRDGFFPFTSTEAESQFLITAAEIYENIKSSGLLDRMKTVGDRLIDKIFYSKVYDKDVALIHRMTFFNFETDAWEEKIQEVYTEDMLDTATALIKLSQITGDNKYDTSAKELLDTVITLQKIAKRDNKKDLDGALYFRVVNYYNDSEYHPSWDVFPIMITESVYDAFTAAYKYSNDKKYLQVRDEYFIWAETQVNSEKFWNKYGMPYLGVDGYGNPIRYTQEKWSADSEVDTERTLRMIYGLCKWKPESGQNYIRILDTPLGKKALYKWYIPQYLNDTGDPTFFTGELAVIPKIYLNLYMNNIGRNKERNEIILELVGEQRLVGDNIAKGVWTEGVFTNIKSSLSIMRALNELSEEI